MALKTKSKECAFYQINSKKDFFISKVENKYIKSHLTFRAQI